MATDSKKWKVCAVIVAAIFCFNTSGLSSLALAADSPYQTASSDSMSPLSQKTKEISDTLNLMKNDLSSGGDPTTRLDELNHQYQAIYDLDKQILEQLDGVEAELNSLLQEGKIPSQFFDLCGYATRKKEKNYHEST